MSSLYELMIVSTTAGSDGLITRAQKYVKDAQAVNLTVNKLGKKQLAYPIKKQSEADYFVFNFEAEGADLKSVTDKLRLEQEDLLRYMLLAVKPVKPSKRKGNKTQQPKEEKKETPKVTVVTKKVTQPKKDAKSIKKVDAKGKSKVASKAKVKGKSK